jgi:DNA-binding CsgD family transcriptional regulator
MLCTAAAYARTFGARLVVISGAAGIGKTALLSLARAELANGATVLHTASRPSSKPYDGVRELFSGRPGFQAALTSAPQDDYATFENLTRLTIGELARTPLALFVDDAEHCDESTLRWLGFLSRRVAGLPLLLVLSLRPETQERSQALAALAARDLTTTVDLGPLGEPEVALLVGRRLGSPPEQPFLDVCLALGGDHPEVLRLLLDAFERHGLSPDAGGAREAEDIGGDALAVAATDWLRDRPKPIRRVAAGVALLGSAGTSVLAALLGLSTIAVDAAVATLREHHVLRPGHGDFAHDAVSRAILDELSSEELDGLCAHGARLLHCEGRPPREVADLLARLPALGEPWMSATLWDAAVDAERSGEPAEAARLLNRALACSPDDVPTTLTLARALSAVDPESARDHLLRVIDRVETAQLRATAMGWLVEAALSAPPSSAAYERLAEVIDAVLSTKEAGLAEIDPELRARGQGAVLNAGLGNGATVRSALERAQLIESPGVGYPANRFLLGKLSTAATIGGRPGREVRRIARAALAIPPSGGELDEGVIDAACALYLAGRPGEALSALATARSADAAWPRCHEESLRAYILLAIGDLPSAVAAVAAATGLAAGRAWALPRLASAEVFVAQGEFAAAEEQLDLADEAPASFWEHQQSLLHRAFLRCVDGDFDTALRCLVRCHTDDQQERANPMDTVRWVAPASMLAEAGNRATVEELVQPQLAVAERWGTREGRALAMLVKGVLATDETGLVLLGEAVLLLKESEFRSQLTLAEYLYGRACYQAGDVVAARRHLREAIVLAVRHGYAALGREARTLLIAAGGWIREPNGDPLGLLTASERRVATHAAAGATNREIAEALFVTLRTVESHLSSTYRKLGVRSRAELAILLGDQATS